ncbi:Uncharacterised protein [Corynebacterium kutscheri]|uniref:Uncharacterized protein n=1 Tax=Corynebacterium kutscheri TaxID=35755 RepID=A0A0F6TE72_9CORY|nr:hypothetical protein [Corynebacterium kutscheri]AKE41834.1 hypothetical protein UL82_08385 [Corynebacterium kutscheri]VEH04315.1 Uncharacterised protein [Corynebacterium kutscheri]VEH10162.1 Uncharacterised protein [Corynebacterium kutscheri]VEH80244.1 Uncharacterised protein [Corynebacterium kutscheri]
MSTEHKRSNRRRVIRRAEVDYDRKADTPITEVSADEQRVVLLDEDTEQLVGKEFYLHERPPHHG